VIGNRNVTSLTGKEYELVEKAQKYSQDAVGIFATTRRSSNTRAWQWVKMYFGLKAISQHSIYKLASQ